MNVPAWMWIATIGGLLVLLAVDLVIVDRKPHEVTIGEAARWVIFYVAMAAVFGLGIWYFSGGQYATEFFAGYITEYSLSVDNLFVFVLIMARFAVPREYRQKVLIVGIVLALFLRAVFIALGAQAIARFDWLFYLFGAFLIWTAWKLLRQEETEEAEFSENAALRAVKKIVPATTTYHGAALTTRIDGRRVVTPMLIVMVAVGTTDLLFAVDSIPAIFGLTKEPYLVLTANAFALMGLRQLFFLVGGLLDRLVHLSKGLAVVLAFIGLKLIFEALHHHGVSWAPETPITVSLGVILVTLAVTTVWSLHTSKRAAQSAVEGAENVQRSDDAPLKDTQP